MRVLMVVHSLRRGGAERVLLELARTLSQRGHEVMVCGLLAVDEYPEPTFARVRRRFLSAASAYRWPHCVPRLARKLRCVVREFNPDVIQIHTPTAAWVGACAGVPQAAVHVLHGYGSLERGGGVKGWVLKSLDRWVFRRLGRQILVVSPAMVPAVAAYYGCSPDSIHVVTNGIDLDRFPFHERQPGTQPVMVMVGTLARNKGQHLALQAIPLLLREIPGARLRIIGEGALRSELEQGIQERRLADCVSLLGRRDDVPQLLAQSHLFWHLSGSEGLPLAVAEAMATGLPVVGFDVRGVREVVAHTETGLLVGYEDVEAVAEQSRRALQDPELYRTMSRSARARIERQFNGGRMVVEHEALLCEMMKAR